MSSNKSISKRFPPSLSGLLIGVIIFSIGLLLTYSQFQIHEKSLEAETREDLELIEQSLQYGIREVNSIALLLSQSVDQNGNVEDFEAASAELIAKYPTVNVLELINNGIVTHVYPIEGYEEILGYDLYQNERIKLELFKAAENNDIYFSGPIMLVEGELGIIGLLPFDQNKDGFKVSAVILYLDTFLNMSQMSALSDRYYFQLSKINLETEVEEFFIESTNGHEIDWSVEQFALIPEGDWKLYAHRKSDSHFPTYIILILLIAALISVLIGYLSYKLFSKPFELEKIVHDQSKELLDSRELYKESSELLTSVLESPQNIIIFSLDEKFRYIAFNENYEKRIIEYYDVLVKHGNVVFDSYPEDAVRKLKENLTRAMKGDSFDIIHDAKSLQGKDSTWQNWFSPIKDKSGVIVGVTVFSVDITQRINAEKEKTTLLAEIHHRVKNNLAIVSGLLELQKVEANDKQLSEIFDQSISRIISIALVHELMYNNDDLSSVDVHAYLEKLIPAISATMQNQAQNVQFHLDIEEYQLNINEAIPLGLMLNELITNSFKYAFNAGAQNSIGVTLNSRNDRINVDYSDNGIGFPDHINFDTPKNLGLNLVHAQLQQLDAIYSIDTDNKFNLEFSFISSGKGSHSNF